MITVDLGDGVIGEMEEHLLEGPFISIGENAHEYTKVTIYKYRGKVVHRSAHVVLKEGVGIEGLLGRLRNG